MDTRGESMSTDGTVEVSGMGRELKIPCGRLGKDGPVLCVDELDSDTEYKGDNALYCLTCGGELVVHHHRKDKSRAGEVYYLSHKANDGNSCHGVGGETMLHLLMKQAFMHLIGRELFITFPHELGLKLDHSQWAYPWVLKNVLIEKSFDVHDDKQERDTHKKPDVSADFTCGPFPVPVSIEICVTHEKTTDDLALLGQLGRPVLEIYPDLIVDESRLGDPEYVSKLRWECECYLMSKDDSFDMSWRGTFPRELALSLACRNKRHDVPAAIRNYHERPLWEWSAGALVVYGRYPSIDRMVECIRTRERRRAERIKHVHKVVDEVNASVARDVRQVETYERQRRERLQARRMQERLARMRAEDPYNKWEPKQESCDETTYDEEQLAAAVQQLRKQKMPQRRKPVRDLSGIPGVKPILWPVWPQDTDWPGTKPSLQPVTMQVPPWIAVDITCDMARCADVAWYVGCLRQAVYDTVYASLPIFTCLYLTCPRDGVMSTKALYVAELGLRVQARKYHMVPVSRDEASTLWQMTNDYRQLMTFAMPFDRDGLPGGVALAARTWSDTLNVTVMARLMRPRDARFCVADYTFERKLYDRLVQRLDAAYQLDVDGCDERGDL